MLRSFLRLHIVYAATACLLSLTPVSSVVAQNGVPTMADDMAFFYNTAMQAFQKADWATASANLEKFIAMVEADPKQVGRLQPIYYMLGASYFNQPAYDKAIAAFRKYLAKFPNGDKAGEIRLAIAQAFMGSKDFPEAIKAYELIEGDPAYREQALTAEADAFKELGKSDDVIRVLEKLIGSDIKTTAQANGAITLAQVYAEKQMPGKAIALLGRLQTKTPLIENLVALNGVAVNLGDDFYDQKLYMEAIQAFRAVRTQEEVLKLQSQRIAMMERRITDNLKSTGGNPQLFVQMTQVNNQIKARQVEAKTLLEEFEKLPDFAPGLLLRMARCWYDAGKKWEALSAYDRILTRYPKSDSYEPALFAEVSVFAEVHGRQTIEPCEGCTGIAATVRPGILQTGYTRQLCERYLKEFPEGPNAGTVGYLSGAVALEAEDPASAEKAFTEILEKQPSTPYREEIRFLLGNAKFMQGNFEEAQKDYKDYLKDYPQGQYIEDVTYRVAVAQVFAGKFEEALPDLGAYLAKFPQGQSAADAKYRIAVCNYAAQKYDEVIKACKDWFAAYPGNAQEGEVQALLGDCYAAQNKLEEAIPVYLRSYKTAATDEVMNYSLFEASKHLQKLGKWSEVAKMFEEFVRDKPDSTSVVAAMYWIGKAKVREGKTDEAKAFFVETLKKYIAEPKREAVEQLLSQLAQLCAKRPRLPVPPPAPSAPVQQPTAGKADLKATPAETQAPAPEPPPPYDPVAELDKQLAPLEQNANPTAQARLLYARAELAAARKQPEEQEKIYREMAERFKPQDLSPVLLANVGDYLFQTDDKIRAAAIYTRLEENFLKSDYLDFAYVGLGEIAFENKDYPKALELFTDALEKIAASMKVKEATIGRAKTLLELGQYEESKKLFEQVAGVREWRGESTAMAIYELGEVEARRGHWAEAIAHYRRVFVAYQKFSPWVARAYLRSAESFDKMGQRKDAIDSLREMLRSDKLKQFPEAQEARKRLEEWGTPAA